MANPEWGTKRVCQSCGTKFYDLQRDPIVCPKCQSEYDPEAFLKTRRTRTVVGADKDTSPAMASEESDVELDADETLDDAAVDDAGDEEDDDMIEDASELGEDDDDMAEVIENVDDEEER